MPEYWSDQESAPTVVTSGGSYASKDSRKSSSVRQEAKHMANSIKNKRGHGDELVIAVVRKGSVEALERRLPHIKSWSWADGKVLDLFKKKSDIIVTTDTLLQTVIDQVGQQGNLRALSIMASGEIEHLALHVAASRISQLKLHRCGYGGNAHNDLLIDGASTFHEIRLDEWEAVKPKKRKGDIWIHTGVVIAPDMTRAMWAKIRRTFEGSEAHKESLRKNFDSMEETMMDGDGWWRNWRGPLAAILGILAGGAGGVGSAAAVTSAAAGAYVNFAWGSLSLSAGAGAGGFSAMATAVGAACGGAVLLGGGVAAAVYFIPWVSVFGMLQSVLSWAWDQIVSLWNKFKDWWTSTQSCRAQGRHRMPVPMVGIDGSSCNTFRF